MRKALPRRGVQDGSGTQFRQFGQAPGSELPGGERRTSTVRPTTTIAEQARGKLLVTTAAVLLLTPLATFAQAVDVTRTGQTFTVRYTATFAQDELSFGQAFGYDTVSLSDGALADPGKPMLPTETVHIALSAGMTVTSVRLLSAETIDLPGQYLVLPAQPPRRTSDPVAAVDLVPPDPVTYASSEPYPAQVVRFVQECDLAGQAFAVVELRPVQYRPAQRRLSLCTSIAVALEGVSGYVCGDYLPAHISAAGRADRERAVASLVVNPDDVVVQTAPGQGGGQRGVSPGDYDYVIITTDNWVTAFQPLADWKTKKGVPANIVTLTWIYSTYAGSTNQDKIRAFVQDAYTNWGTAYFLMGGDTAYVPCHMHTFSGVDADPVPNDAYFADFDDDWVCEVNLGRASVNNTGSGSAGIAAFISKIMTFEKTPPMTDYPLRVGLFGFDLDSSTHTETAKGNIRTLYMPAFTGTTVYDSQGGNHYTNVIAAINAGQMLMNHADHSSNNFMGTGYVNHGWGLGNGDMDALTNGTRQGILYSMGCDPCAFDSSACIAEHFVRNVNGGGIAFIGNSRYGWYNPGNLSTLSLLYDKYFFRSLVQQNFYKLGAAVSDHKNDHFPADDYYKYVWTELTLLGDPELPVWTGAISGLAVTHPDSVDVGTAGTFLVHVTDGTTALAGATVCLWKPGDIYLIQQTSAAGDAAFTFTPTSTGTLSVTVTKQNFLPYEGLADVVESANYSLTVNTVGQGSVTLDPPGGTYPANATIQLIAEAAGSWHFDHWSGDLSGSSNPATLVMDGPKTVTATFGLIGDTNCDGDVGFGDINPFVLALTDPAQYQQLYPSCYLLNGDINQDGVVGLADINPFVNCLVTGNCP
jgi:hypothetical protein